MLHQLPWRWLENEQYVMIFFESWVISSDEFLVHSYINTFNVHMKREWKTFTRKLFNWYTKIIIGSNKIKWKSKNDCFYGVRFPLTKQIQYSFSMCVSVNTLFLCDCSSAIFVFLLCDLISDRQSTRNRHTHHTHSNFNVQIHSYQMKVRQFSFLFINVLLSGIWNREKRIEKNK